MFTQLPSHKCSFLSLLLPQPTTNTTCIAQATDAANAAYIPDKKELCAAAGITPQQLLVFEPQTNTTRPAYAVWVDEKHKRIIWGFR